MQTRNWRRHHRSATSNNEKNVGFRRINVDRGQLRLIRNESELSLPRQKIFLDETNDALIWEGRFINGSRMFEYEGRLWNAAECNLTNIYALREAGFELPLTTGYDWPIRPGWRPRDHQRVMVDFLLSYPRAFN